MSEKKKEGNVSDQNLPKEEGKQQATEKKIRRGISNETRATTRKKFTEQFANPTNFLFGMVLDKIEKREVSFGDEVVTTSFAGLQVPMLFFTFRSNEKLGGEYAYITKRFMPVESSPETIPGGDKEWMFNQQIQYLKHFIDVIVKGGEPLTEAEEDALDLGYLDYDETGSWVHVEPEEILKGWNAMFDSIVNMFETYKDGKPAYLDNNGNNVPLWAKLIRYVKSKKTGGWVAVDNEDLVFPGFPGEGVICKFEKGKAAGITFNAANERIHIIPNYEKPKKAAAPTIGGMAGAGMAQAPMNAGFSGGGMPSPDFVNGGNPNGDMPF